jgi:hypothetical protein
MRSVCASRRTGADGSRLLGGRPARPVRTTVIVVWDALVEAGRHDPDLFNAALPGMRALPDYDDLVTRVGGRACRGLSRR